MTRLLRALLTLALTSLPMAGQWVHYPTPGIPRTKDGKPNLAAPTPRLSNGKPDFSGIWEAPSDKYLADISSGSSSPIPMQPWAAQVFQERQENFGKDRPSGRCLPHSVTDFDAHFMPKKIVHTPGLLAMLFESYHSWRQIFTDGRPLPEQRDPAWFGYSVGSWDADTLVVHTIGVNDKTWLDDAGHPHTEAMQITEHFRRPDFGHMQVEITIDDPKAYTRPWTVNIPWEYVADTDLLDWVCENEKDVPHLVGK